MLMEERVENRRECRGYVQEVEGLSFPFFGQEGENGLLDRL